MIGFQKTTRISIAAALFGLFCLPLNAGVSDKVFDGNGTDAESAPASPINIRQAPPRRKTTTGLSWIKVGAGRQQERSQIADLGLSIEEVDDSSVSGVATAKTIQRIKQAGFKILSQSMLEEFPQADKAYHTYDQVLSALNTIASSNKAASLVTVGTSLQGRQIQGVRFNTTAAGDAPSNKPGILFLGTHHAREHLSTEVPLLLAQWLSDNSDKPNVSQLLKTRDIFIVPLVNPDGSEYDTTGGQYHMQRKNMRDNGDGTTGVDLNRNYSYHWGEGGASKDTSDETYRGPSAFSEPETQAVNSFVEAHANLTIILSYHTYSELILYPWGYTNDPLDDAPALKAYQAMAQTMAGMTGYKPEQSSALYIASGDTTDWAWGTHKIFSYTFELTPKSMNQGGFYPGAGVIQPTFQKNIQPALYLIGLADNPYRAGQTASERLSRETRFPSTRTILQPIAR